VFAVYPFVFKNRDPARTKRCLFVVDAMIRISKLPGAGLHPWLWPSKTDMRWLPINEDIQLGEDMPMPITILDRLIEETSHRMIYDYCGCRLAYDCKDYPVETGCLMMGDSAAGANPDFCHEVDADEAKEHVRKAVDAGLVPLVGKARLDNSLFAIRDTGHLLTVCLCCECCCLTKYMSNAPLKYLDPMFRPLEGVTIEVTEECEGCGNCVEKCYIKAIEIIDEKAVIGPYCRSCGRCATVCASDAIKVTLDDPAFVDKAIERIRSYVKYD
jgi:UDP-glucose 4-epimerase